MTHNPKQGRRALRVGLVTTAVASLFLAGCGGGGDDDVTDFRVRVENVSPAYPFIKSGAFTTPVGASSAGPIGPGGAYEFSFTAPRGSSLSLATMFVPSNDYFYAPGEAGISLYDADGNPISGDVTSKFQLWDAGTEADEEPGVGLHQAQRQAGANTGDSDPVRQVRLVEAGKVPPVASVLRVTLASGANGQFTVRVENVSTASTLVPSSGPAQAVPLAPGAWVVHSAPAPLFTVGSPDAGHGLEAIAEDGDPAALVAYLAGRTGVTVPLSPGVWAVHSGTDPFFTMGQNDRAMGLERIAEDGDPTELRAALRTVRGVESSGAFNTPVGGTSPSAIGPGGAYEFTVRARPSERLSLATMYVASNDLFLAPNGQGIALHDANGKPVDGDVTASFQLWDAGTEVNQEPGVGADQAQRQAGPNTGATESKAIEVVNDGYTYAPPSAVLKVTVTPQ